MAEDLQRHPEILNVSDSSLFHGFMESNLSLSNTSTLLQQLETIDNAACGWIQFMSKVGLAKVEGQAGLLLGDLTVGKSRKGVAGLFKNTLKI